MTSELQVIRLFWAVLGILMFGGLVARRFSDYTLRTKLTIAFLLVSLGPLTLLIFINYRSAQAALTEAANQSLYAAASQTAARIDAFIQMNLVVIETEAQLPILTEYLSLPAAQRANSTVEEQVIHILQTFGRKDAVFISSYALLDRQGQNVVDTDLVNINRDESRRSYFQNALETGQPYVSPVEFEPDNQAYIHFSSLVQDANGRIVGVLRVRYNAAVLQQLIVQDNNLAGPQSFAILLDEHHITLAYGLLSHLTGSRLTFKSVVPLDLAHISQLQALRRLPDRPLAELSTNMPLLEEGLTSVAGRSGPNNSTPYFTTPLDAIDGKLAAVSITQMETQPWLVVFAQPQEVFLAPVRQQTQLTLLFALGMTAVVASIASAFGQFLAGPIIRLTAVTSQLAAGNLHVQAPVEAQDEIGQFAAVFNHMTARLRGLIGSLEQNVDQLKQAQKALQESEKRYRSIFENAVEGIYRSTPDGRFTDVNPALVQMLGYDSAAEVLTLRLAEDVYVDPEERERLRILYEPQGIARNVETRWKRKDGKSIIVTLDARVIRDEQGHVLYYEGLVQDITERKQLEEQLRQSQKLEAIGRLAGGIAHDFNNILTVILSYSDLLLHHYREKSEQEQKPIKQIKLAGEQAAALTQHLLAFSRRQVLELKFLHLNTIVSNIKEMLQRLIGEDIELVTVLDDGLWQVKADPGQFEQVILNLAVNARDAMPQGGKLIIETKNVYLDKTPTYLEVEPGSYVMLSVTDSGIGMDHETKAHIFEPFFTTKEKGKGTGLGLATVHGIISQSGGTIQVQSEPGQGTTFQIYLPRIDGVIDSVESTPAADISEPGTETILLVEDEEMVRELAYQVLEEKGYTVLQAKHGEEALRLCEQYAAPIDLLLTDIVMPGINGRDLAKYLATSRPDIKVLFMSGYTDSKVMRSTELRQEEGILQKPFTPETLTRKVREMLDA